MNPSESLLIRQQLDALHQRDEDARKAISALCARIAHLEEAISLHNMAISHCTGGCRVELHKSNKFES